jgi:hypothetical protein
MFIQKMSAKKTYDHVYDLVKNCIRLIIRWGAFQPRSSVVLTGQMKGKMMA